MSIEFSITIPPIVSLILWVTWHGWHMCLMGVMIHAAYVGVQRHNWADVSLRVLMATGLWLAQFLVADVIFKHLSIVTGG